MTDEQQRQIDRLQHNLTAIRSVAGWTTQQLGDKLGITKATVSNLENHRSPMTLIQYIAIRSILDLEIRLHPENQMLPQLVELLLDRDLDSLSPQERKQLESSVQTLTAAGSKRGLSMGLGPVLAAVSVLSPIFMPAAAIAYGLAKTATPKSPSKAEPSKCDWLRDIVEQRETPDKENSGV